MEYHTLCQPGQVVKVLNSAACLCTIREALSHYNYFLNSCPEKQDPPWLGLAGALGVHIRVTTVSDRSGCPMHSYVNT